MEKKCIIDNKNLMSEWDWDKNSEIGLNPNTLTEGSNKKAWWICEQKHSWYAVIVSRVKGHGCSYCSNQKVLKGYNDLETVLPVLSKEWNHHSSSIRHYYGIHPQVQNTA